MPLDYSKKEKRVLPEDPFKIRPYAGVSTSRDTTGYRMVSAAGFTIYEPMEAIIPGWFSTKFQCVCGKTEYLHWPLNEAINYTWNAPDGIVWIDIAQILLDFGAVSEEHLREDGYSQEEINLIQAKMSVAKEGIPWEESLAA